ncbi:XdhC family protein [Nocardia rhamnosiphila]|uniref:XdhC family protein n=1 Tax=Nocardia rhamnosiphila TaxID=426716 RepID=UPI000690A552|nr:XdhC/CoxI family protein [Nocardia rhamnosiphila]
MRDLAADLVRWHAEGVAYAVATVVAVRGSAPLPLGAAMAVDGAGAVRGSLSGGCVEGAVYELCAQVLATGEPARQTFGYSDSDAFAVGLTCGGELDVFVQRIARPQYPVVEAALDPSRPVALVRDLATAALAAVTAEAVITDGGDWPDPVVEQARALLHQGVSDLRTVGCGPVSREIFVAAFTTPPRMIVFGANIFAAALCRVGKLLGYHVTVCEGRAAFADRARLPEADEVVTDWPHRYLRATAVDSRTVLCVLTHDPKFDIPVLVEALRQPVAYIGAMGSRRADAERRAHLRGAGVTEDRLARLRSPIGLQLGGRTPEETALAIGAEIVALCHGGSARSLSDTQRPIHTVGPGVRESDPVPAVDHRVRSCGVSTSSGEPVPSHGTC